MGGPVPSRTSRSIVRTCTGDVWVRRRSCSGSTPSRLGGVEVQRVPQRPGRMGGRHVERLEVEPVRLDLGAGRDPEPHPDEHVFEAFPRLGHDVGMTGLGVAERLGQVEPLGCELLDPRRRVELGPSSRHGLLEGGPRRVDGRSQLLALLRREVAHPRLERRDPGLLAEQFGVDRRELVRVDGLGDPGCAFGRQLRGFVARVGGCGGHSWAPVGSVGGGDGGGGPFDSVRPDPAAGSGSCDRCSLWPTG